MSAHDAPLSSTAVPLERRAALVVVAVATVWVGIAGLRWGTWSAGSADASGYISQSALWLDGTLVERVPLAASVPWANAGWTFAPLGYRPGVEPGTLVPVYPVGLPLVMAALRGVGGADAVFVAVPVLGMMAVLATALLATRMASASAGAVAALLLATSPTFLFSLMWPMSDVPAAALWVLGLVLATGTGLPSAIGAGLAIALAVLTRPNLVLVALAPGAFLLWRAMRAPADRRAWTRLLVTSGLGAAGCLGVAAVHTVRTDPR
ncbi:MAG: glycosyltransferase family 39 protein [Vicinamibacterales bacterium]